VRTFPRENTHVRILTWHITGSVCINVSSVARKGRATGEAMMTATIIYEIAAELGAVLGDAVSEAHFEELVHAVARERMTPASA